MASVAAIPGGWELAALACKLLVYAGTASLVGGCLCLWLYSDNRPRTRRASLVYMATGAVLGCNAAAVAFLIDIGRVNGRGASGMLDPEMGAILLDTQAGDAVVLRLAGFLLAFTAVFICLQRTGRGEPAPGLFRLLNIAGLLAFLCVAASFRVVGHLSVMSSVAQLAIVLHLFAFAAWIGSLYPLYLLTLPWPSRARQAPATNPDPVLLQEIMMRFGRHARAVVTLLAVSGVVMLLELLDSPGDLLSSAWGRALLLKLTLVLAILGLAAFNKLRLTPAVARDGGSALGRSIRVEMIAAVLILLVTAWLATVVGPPATR